MPLTLDRATFLSLTAALAACHHESPAPAAKIVQAPIVPERADGVARPPVSAPSCPEGPAPKLTCAQVPEFYRVGCTGMRARLRGDVMDPWIACYAKNARFMEEHCPALAPAPDCVDTETHANALVAVKVCAAADPDGHARGQDDTVEELERLAMALQKSRRSAFFACIHRGTRNMPGPLCGRGLAEVDCFNDPGHPFREFPG